MAPKALTTNAGLSDEQVDAAAVKLPPIPDNVLLMLRNLQDQITGLDTRVDALETP